MDKTEVFEEEISTFVHDLFLNNEYLAWRKSIKSFTPGKWHSLIVKLEKYEAPLERIKGFGETTFSKLVFSYIESPDYKESQMLMIQFTITGSMWHSLIWHCPERN